MAKAAIRYIRLTELIPELLNMVDGRKMAFGVWLSYLQKLEQMEFLNSIARCEATPSLSQAQQLKGYSQSKNLTADVTAAIMSEKTSKKVILTSNKLKKYFPNTYTQKQMENATIKILEAYRK